MTLEEKYQVSCYQEIARLQEEKEIYLVRHMETGEFFVKKVVEIYSRSIYERIMELKVKHIPQIFLLVEDNGKLIVIEEYIHGDSLDRLLKTNGLMPENQVVQIALAVCDILQCLHYHQIPIIHRDIKPSNIMLSKDGVVKLIDFNAAKEVDAEKSEDTRLMGTIDFAAPEQYGFGQSSPRTDIYALGVTMNYMLTGDYPKNKLWNGKLKKVIQKCTMMNSEERYQDVRQLKKALQGKERCDNRNKQKQSIFIRNLYSYNAWLPVGFRSGVLWKMILALFGYLLMADLGLTLSVNDSTGESATGIYLWLNRIFVLLMFLGVVLISGNYRGIRNNLPLMNGNKILHYVMMIVYIFIFLFLMLVLLTLLSSVLFSK